MTARPRGCTSPPGSARPPGPPPGSPAAPRRPCSHWSRARPLERRSYINRDIIYSLTDISEALVARTVIDLDDELVASVAKELGTRTKKDTVNAALREVLSNRRRGLALTRLRDAAADGAIDLARLQDKENYRR